MNIERKYCKIIKRSEPNFGNCEKLIKFIRQSKIKLKILIRRKNRFKNITKRYLIKMKRVISKASGLTNKKIFEDAGDMKCKRTEILQNIKNIGKRQNQPN